MKRRHTLCLSAALLALGATVMVRAQDPLIWDNDPAGHVDTPHASQVSFGSVVFDAQAADDFRLVEQNPDGPASFWITRVDWLGGYYDLGGDLVEAPTKTRTFRIILYADAGGQPPGGPTDPTGLALATYDFSVTDAHELHLGSSNYSYWADLDPPFLADSDLRYWIVAQCLLDFSPQWGFFESATQTGYAAYEGFPDFGIDYWAQTDPPVDMAFKLRGAEPQAPLPPINPFPPDGATKVDTLVVLSWEDGGYAESYDVYFGTVSPPGAGEFQGNQTETTFDPGPLEFSTTYYWRIDAINPLGTTTGTEWSFRVRNPPAAKGDLNCDGAINGFDIDPFVLALTNPDQYEIEYPDCDVLAGDINGDGLVNGFDIDPFVDVLTSSGDPVEIELAGNALDEYPHFEFVRAFNADASIQVAIDPTQYAVIGRTCDIYVVEAKSAAEWAADPSLVDARPGGPQTETFTGTTIEDNIITVAGAYELDADAGLGLGVGYDVVFDMNVNGEFGEGDFIDGRGDEAGLYVIHDTTVSGPLAVTEIFYSGGTWLTQDTYYPTDIASMGQLPLVVVSHGNGHYYTWYDHIGYHMASYGYIVMAHKNNTGPGIEYCSTTTLTNTDYIIGNQDTIGGGVLDGHLDSSRIVWIGHSRGAEGITRAYDRIYDGDYTPVNYVLDDIILLSSMLPTDFLGTNRSNPHEANYHLWTASGDADVSGIPGNDIAQTFHLHDRATRTRHSTVVQGAGHGDFHDGGGSSVFTGPCPIGRARTHLVQLGYFLPLIKHYAEGNIPATDFFWRQWERFQPIGAPYLYCATTGGDAVVVNNTYRNRAAGTYFVIDDYQTETALDVSSSGGAVSYTVANVYEGRLDDANSSFTWMESDPMNGMTYARASDTTRGVVFDWDGSSLYYEWDIVPAAQDFTAWKDLSFRTCQGTRHPYTVVEIADLTFTVTLRDSSGTTSSINIGAYGVGGTHGGGVEEPYQRTGAGEGAGWGNEFEQIRIRLTDFLNNGSYLDLTEIVALRLDVGPGYGSNEGRIGVDEVELTSD